MKKQQVLILWCHPLLRDILKNILSQREDIILIGLWKLTPQVIPRLVALSPDIVLIAASDTDCDQVDDLMAQILFHYPNLPLLHIGLEKDTICLYTAHTRPARSAELINLIHELASKATQDDAENHP